MTEYDVWIGLKIGNAINTKDAAERAHQIIQEPGTNWLCRVINCETKEETTVDLDKVI
jgi:hypothetical protein